MARPFPSTDDVIAIRILLRQNYHSNPVTPRLWSCLSLCINLRFFRLLNSVVSRWRTVSLNDSVSMHLRTANFVFATAARLVFLPPCCVNAQHPEKKHAKRLSPNRTPHEVTQDVWRFKKWPPNPGRSETPHSSNALVVSSFCERLAEHLDVELLPNVEHPPNFALTALHTTCFCQKLRRSVHWVSASPSQQ